MYRGGRCTVPSVLLKNLFISKLCLFHPCGEFLEVNHLLGGTGSLGQGGGLLIGSHNFLIHRMQHYVSMPKEKAPEHIPLLFIASPSTKDPTWEDRFPGRALGPG